MPINPLLMQAGSQAIDTVFGLALENHNDRRQLKQQQKLGEQQLKFNKEMTDHQAATQLQMWKNTNYQAQMNEMKKAGLSPGLMYGMSGAGGTTTGGGAAGVSAPSAPSGGNEIMGMQLMNAQRALIEAQTENVKADTTKKSGVDTKLGETQIQNLMTGIQTEKAKQTMMNVQTRIAEIEADIKTESYEDSLDTIKYTVRKMMAEIEGLEIGNEINEATKAEKISIIQGELIGLGLSNEMKKLGMKLTEEQIKATTASVSQGWKSLDIQQQNAITNMANSQIAHTNANTNIMEYIEKARNNQFGNQIAQGALDLQKMIQNVPESTKLTVGTIINVLTTILRRK